MIQNPRPPKKWFDDMVSHVSKSYPRRRAETIAHWKAELARVVGGIWWKQYSQEKRDELIAKYDKGTQLRLANPKLVPCPGCRNPTPVVGPNLYLRCRKCGRSLISVKVRRPNPNRK